ncbi:MAG: hypothetical protein LUI02_02035 [Clostridiales bacterium]|nr:hypothetical protein [Clostridiales bacterium]
MKKKLFERGTAAAVVTVLALSLIACSGTENDTESAAGQETEIQATEAAEPTEAVASEETTEKSYEDLISLIPEVDDDTIVWAVSDWWPAYLDGYADKLNARLVEDGYPYKLYFWAIPDASYWETDEQAEIFGSGVYDFTYWEALDYALSSGVVDIVCLPSVSGTAQTPAELIRTGNLMELSSYLESEDGSALYDVFPEDDWNTVQVDGGIYVIPNQSSAPGNQFFIFNKSYFTEEMLEDFDGGIDSLEMLADMLEEMDLSDVSYPFIGGFSPEDVAPMCGYVYRDGAFVSLETGDAYDPFETEEFRAYLTQMNRLYKDGIYQDVPASEEDAIESEMDFVVCISTLETVESLPEDVLSVQLPFARSRSLNLTNGICKNSPKAEQALELLTLLYTDPEYANLLILGEEGEDYVLTDDGFVDSDASESAKGMYWRECVTGVYDLVHPSASDIYQFDRLETKMSLYETDANLDNIILGFSEDMPEYDDQVTAMADIVFDAAYYLWQCDDIDAAIEDADAKYRNAGSDEVVAELDRQIKEWLQE